MIDARAIYKESIPVLSVCAMISVFSGLFLGNNEDLLKMLPGILVIVPSFNAINGNVSSVIASRLSSALHMGLIKPDFRRSKTLESNVYAMAITSVLSFFMLGLAAAALNSFFGGEAESFFLFPVVTFFSGLVTISVLILLAIFASYMIYRNGIDPDNVVVPILTTVGDFMGIGVLLLITGMVL